MSAIVTPSHRAIAQIMGSEVAVSLVWDALRDRQA
jgi:hypothetical protein